ncbi:hypothetical protein EB796_003221 [Bugula neritina]|uniref:Uncharacterized protein n=1 Tax=Bugula neritina TaxID=10212 RepID=A0A7J7KJM8_BUGNE|nr:hypothetical protein EB796_003221 [Bugula neritina]
MILRITFLTYPALSFDDCTCFEKGNYYSPVSSDDCRSFTQRTAFLPAETLKCPYGLQFDVQTCVCNYPKDTVCPQYCPAPYTPTPNPAPSCSENGNTYRQVPGTHCQKFTQETATLPPQVHSCPYGLKFDLDTCVCNFPALTTCTV